MEERSGHPLAKAITGYAHRMGLEVHAADLVENLTGRGMRAIIDTQEIWVGGKALWDERGFDPDDALSGQIRAYEDPGRAVALVSVDEKPAALIAISDAIRTDTQKALDKLAQLGIQKTIMLSGDNHRAAASIVGQAWMSEFKAGLMLEDKLDVIRQLIQTERYVGMVGDGVNDAPALAQATVGIALGSAGNDIALEAADVALMSPDLCKLSFAVGLGRAAQRITVQNLLISLVSIAFLAISGLLGWFAMGLTVLFHEGTTLLVVLNAMRLFRFKQAC